MNKDNEINLKIDIILKQESLMKEINKLIGKHDRKSINRKREILEYALDRARKIDTLITDIELIME